MSPKGLAVLALLAALMAPTAAHAHPVGLATLTIEQDRAEPERFTATWRTSAREPRNLAPPLLPPSCTAEDDDVTTHGRRSRIRRFRLHCPQGLRGDIQSRPGSDVEVLATLRWADGHVQRGRLTEQLSAMGVERRSPSVPEAAATSGGRPASPGGLALFVGLGFEHVLAGWDHLLFVLVLLMLAWPAGTVVRWRALAAAITGFTLAHSLTLALSVTGTLSPPGPPIEAAIAWSVVVAAAALLRAPQGSTSWRRLMGIAGVFGLLHGFGFAGALREVVGDGDVELAVSLVGFNLGVEAGQLTFAAAVVGFGLFIGRAKRPSGWLDAATAYGVGSVAAFWVFERLAAMV